MRNRLGDGHQLRLEDQALGGGRLNLPRGRAEPGVRDRLASSHRGARGGFICPSIRGPGASKPRRA
jgi:hypothetical protein